MKSIILCVVEGCNTFCEYCFRACPVKKGQMLSLNFIKDVFDEAEKVDSAPKSILLTGGETLLHPEISAIVAEILDRGWRPQLQTNGILTSRISKEFLRLLTTKPTSVKISLDGPTVETHEYWRGRGTFKRVVKGIKHLTDSGVRVGIKVVINPVNIHVLEELCALCVELGVAGLSHNMLRPEGRALNLVGDDYPTELETTKELCRVFSLAQYRHLINGNEIQNWWLTGGYCKDWILYVHSDGHREMKPPLLNLRQPESFDHIEKVFGVNPNLRR